MTAVPPRPTAPDEYAGDELRSAIAATLWHTQPEYCVSPWGEISETTRERYRAKADAVLALPALRDVLAERDRLRETVQRVRELAREWLRDGTAPAEAIRLRWALADPS